MDTTTITPTFITEWGIKGSGDGEFFDPWGIATDASGSVYVADSYNHRIQKFDADGASLNKWGSLGGADGQFNYPFGVATDASGSVYVVDQNNRRVQKFDADGTFLNKWGSHGTGDGQFNYPNGVATDASGNVYVSDAGNDRIQKFDAGGTFITKWGSYGTGDGQFVSPVGIATDASGNVYVLDVANYRVQKFAFRAAYEWEGFFPPVENPPAFNRANAGRAIPVKFSLGGDMGLDVLATGSPTSHRIDCDSSNPVDLVEETVTAGSSSLSYDATTDTYTYVWKTDKTWAGTCRQLVVKLNDGSTEHVANFKFVK